MRTQLSRILVSGTGRDVPLLSRPVPGFSNNPAQFLRSGVKPFNIVHGTHTKLGGAVYGVGHDLSNSEQGVEIKVPSVSDMSDPLIYPAARS